MVELDFDQGILRDKASRTHAKALAGSARALANWAMACCGSKVPRGAMPSITTFLSHGYGRVVRPPQGEADYRLAVMAGSN